jgi:hypothetical protein
MKNNDQPSEHEKKLHLIRTAITDYINSEGCGCCEGCDHDEHKKIIAELLDVPPYSDNSGYDFDKFKSKP